MSEQTNEETAFNSPIPLFKKLNDLIFGDQKPAFMLRITIWINLGLWFMFQLWHILSYFAITYRDVILAEKKINVEILILNRGAQLFEDSSLFLVELLAFHKIAILTWLVFFVGCVLMWRKSKLYIYFTYIPLLLHPLLMLFYLGSTYLNEDTTFFDKLCWIILLLNTITYSVMLRLQKGEEIDFFQTSDE
jgi:hypothetical protein